VYYVAKLETGVSMLGTPFAGLIETAINTLISRDIHAREALKPMQGKVIEIRLQGTPIQLFFIPGSQSIQVFSSYSAEPDTLIKGSVTGFLKLAQGDDDPLFNKEVIIEGDVASGQAIRKLLQAIDIDWEEELSLVTGDLVAHKSMRLLQQFKGWLRNSGDKLQQDVSEFLQMDNRDLPLPEQVNRFIEDTSRLRNDVDRLEARLQRIQQALKGQQ
jgi:ubiquinone biosynthesis protein UbiJ